MISSLGMAEEYARALFMLTEEQDITDGVRLDVLTLKEVLARDEGYLRLLDTPALSKEERLALIDESLGSLDVYLVNLVRILTERRLAYLLPRVLTSYLADYDASRGIERVEAITAVAMTEEQIAALTDRLARKTGRTIIISNTVDPTALGGVKLRYMGIQLDGSLRTRLDGLAAELRATVV